MKHLLVSSKTIHPYDGPILSIEELKNTKIVIQPRFAKHKTKRIMELLLALKGQIFLDNKHFRSFMIDYEYQLAFLSKENPSSDILNLTTATSALFIKTLSEIACEDELDSSFMLKYVIEEEGTKNITDQVIYEGRKMLLFQ